MSPEDAPNLGVTVGLLCIEQLAQPSPASLFQILAQAQRLQPTMDQPQHDQTLFLEQLPFETLEGILSHLPQSDLATIATFSRRFSNVVEPFLYRALHIKLPALACKCLSSDWHDSDVLPNAYKRYNGLLENLGCNPKLRSRVTSICFDPQGSNWCQPFANQLLHLAPFLQELYFSKIGPPENLFCSKTMPFRP